MNTESVSPADTGTETSRGKILVWDAPVRIFHWLLVLCFAGAYLSAESERWRLLHVTLGYTMAGLVSFRIVWGLIGTRYARFASFVRGPRAVMNYLRTMLRGKPEHHTGHNPAGAWAIVGLLGLALIISASGWALYNDIGGEWPEDLHEAAANGMLALVGVHVAGVLLASRLHRENLIGAMFSGCKPGRPAAAIRSAWFSVALLVLATVLGFWWLQWNNAPSADALDAGAAMSTRRADHDD
jgi:cytochrome b